MKKNFEVESGEVEAAQRSIQEDKWIPALCEFLCVEGPCMLKVHLVDGVAVNIKPNNEGEGFEQFTKNRGRLCPKAYGLIQKLYWFWLNRSKDEC